MSSPANTSEELAKLVTLIDNATQTAKKHLLNPKPSDRGQTTDPELRNSIAVMQAACTQLCTLVTQPCDTLASVSALTSIVLSNHSH